MTLFYCLPGPSGSNSHCDKACCPGQCGFDSGTNSFVCCPDASADFCSGTCCEATGSGTVCVTAYNVPGQEFACCAPSALPHRELGLVTTGPSLT